MQNTTPDLFSFQLDTPAPVALVQPLPPKSAKPVATCTKVAHFVTLNRVAEAPSRKMLEPSDAAGFWKENIATRPDYDPDRESLWALLVDTKYQLKAVALVSLGSLNESVAHPRECFRAAVAAAAYGVILMHNHPSGDPTPSDADRRLTTRLSQAGDILCIKILDHVIYGSPERYFSFRESGLI